MIRKAAAALVVTIGLVLVLSGTATAHPLGNFTTNTYQEVVASGDRAYVLSVLDLAEIPTFQARPEVARLGRDGYAARLAKRVRAGLALQVDGARRPLAEQRHSLVLPDGAAGLRTTRLEVVFDAGTLAPGAHRLALRNDAFADRLGWREIVIRAERGASLASATVPSTTSSDRLHAYPKGQLRSPLDVRTASAQVTPGDDPGVTPTLDDPEAAAPVRTSDGGFAALINHEDLSLGVIVVSLLVAMFWGAAHALTPGHGKAIVAAYMAGSRGKPRDAFALGGIVTVTHTLGVFALGFVTLLLSEFIVPEDLYPWLNLVSAVLVVGVGASVFYARWKTKGWDHHHHHHDHDHDHGHGHHHHTHDHVQSRTTTTATDTCPSRAAGGVASSPSASQAGCCRAPPRSSSCWPPSPCTGWPSGWS